MKFMDIKDKEKREGKIQEFEKLASYLPTIQAYYAQAFRELSEPLFKACQESLGVMDGPGFGDLEFDERSGESVETCFDVTLLLTLAHWDI